MGLRNLVLVVLITAIMLLPSTAPLVEASASITTPATGQENFVQATRAYVHPILYSDEYWEYGAVIPPDLDEIHVDILTGRILEKLGFRIHSDSTQRARAIILVAGNDPVKAVNALRDRVATIVGVFPAFNYIIVTAWIDREKLEALATTPGVMAILPDVRLDMFIVRDAERLRSALREFELGAQEQVPRPEPQQIVGTGAPHYTVNVTRAIDVWLRFNITGENTVIAIIDTGVDYASPGLGVDAIARDPAWGLPLIFDDMFGLVLTPVPAVWVNQTHIYVDLSKLYVYWPPAYVLKLDTGIALAYYGEVYNYTMWPLSMYWNVTGIPQSSLPPMFGLAIRIMYVPGGVVVFSVPTLVVDYDNDLYYDTVYLDMSTAWYYLSIVLNETGAVIPPAPAAPDYSFADEKPVAWMGWGPPGSDEIAAVDLDGDGYYDFSVGTLSLVEYDPLGIVFYAVNGLLDQLMAGLPAWSGYVFYGPREAWTYDFIGYLWPGIDRWTGRYVSLQYDFHSHGTFCATTAAGRAFPAYVGYGVASITGQAPGAKIAAANALWLGDVIASVYFFSGFTLYTPYGDTYIMPVPMTSTNPWIAFQGYTWYWEYDANNFWQADITSNSYGISGWAIWGWASGMDPVSLVFDYTTLVSGTAHFIAVGNGGPGWGTIASPGSSTLSIGVGAATEFTYRPWYGYLPGGNREVVSWSNRGPTEFGVVKPDIVAIGSFAWAVGRPWDSLGYGVLSGAFAYDLFGGTSQATPMAAGVGALAVSAYKALTGQRMPSSLLKTVLMSSARDLGFDPLSQGSGFVDAYTAVVKTLLLASGRKPTLVYSTNVFTRYKAELGIDTAGINYRGQLPDTVWAEPKLYLTGRPGGFMITYLTIEGRGLYRLSAYTFSALFEKGACDLADAVIDFSGAVMSCSGSTVTVNFTSLPFWGFGFALVFDPAKLAGYDMVEFRAAYPYWLFHPAGRMDAYPYQEYIVFNGFELWYWIDVNRNGVLELNETARIQYDLRGANAFHIQVAELDRQLREIERLVELHLNTSIADAPKKLVLVYRSILNFWPETNMTVIGDFTITVKAYQKVPFRNVRLLPRVFVFGERTIPVFVFMPRKPGMEFGYIEVSNPYTGERILVPVTLSTVVPVVRYRPTYIPVLSETSFYKDTYLRGVFDWTWRYESGDWRVFNLYVRDRAIKALVVELTWPAASYINASNLDVMVYGPWTYYMYDVYTGTVTPVKVHGVQLGAELSASHIAFWDEPQPGKSIIIVPVSGPGLYRLVVRNIHYAGTTLEEPFKVKVYPVTVLTYPYRIYLRPGMGKTVTVAAFIPGGASLFSKTSISLQAASEALAYIAGELFYIPDASDAGIHVRVARTRVLTPGTSLIIVSAVQIRVDRTVDPGVYMVPLLFSSNIPTTSYGYIDSGYRIPLFYWDIIPLRHLVITIR